MNNKSQFYMFAAIILVTLVFVIVSNSSIISTSKIQETKNYLNNYKHEAKIVINNALYANKNISYELRNFTESFISYGEYKNLDFDIMYIYSNNNNLYIVNYLNQSVLVTSLGITVNKEQEISTGFNNTIIIRYQNESYNFNFTSPNEIELKTLFVQND